MARLLSINVGLPKDVAWDGRTVHTGIWKRPVTGPVMLRRLNIDGDGQGDLAGHGGEQRAVLAYQADSYRYWERFLERAPLSRARSARTSPWRASLTRRCVHRRPLPDRRG
jgi:MOSC domain-containing protein YiiM